MTSPPAFVRTRLALLMFLQLAALGAWAPVLGRHLEAMGFSNRQIVLVMIGGAVTTIFTALVAGQVADRWMAIERILAICLFANGALLFLATRVAPDDPARVMKTWACLFGAMLFFGPTHALSSAIAFHHLRDPRGDFPLVRAFGTIGWMAAGASLSAWMFLTDRGIGDALPLGAAFAFVTGAYVLTLPHTPPRRDATGRFAAAKAIAMLRDPSFAVLTLVSFCLSALGALVYQRGAEFYASVGVADRWLSLMLTTGQVSEIAAMLLLPLFYRRLGAKGVMAIGIGAWTLRYATLSLGAPPGLMIAAHALHGICYTFSSVAAQIYIERVCAPDIRASAQGLHSLATAGFGMLAGAFAGGWALQRATADGAVRWPGVWLAGAVAFAALLVLFLAAFRPRDLRRESPVSPPAPLSS